MNPNELEHTRWVAEQNRQDAQRAHDLNRSHQERADSGAIEIGALALKTLVLINGGGAIATLALMGNALDTDRAAQIIGALAGPTELFARGVACAAGAMVLGYLSLYYAGASLSSVRFVWAHPYVEDTSASKRCLRIGTAYLIAAVLAGLGSLWSFVAGMTTGSEGLVTAAAGV